MPEGDVVFAVKHLPPYEWVNKVVRRAAILYAPVDHFGSPGEITADSPLLRRFSRIVIHCHRLRPHFEPFAPVEYLDHPVKFAAPPRRRFRRTGNLLWVGVRSNLPPLVKWINQYPLPAPLDILTNPEDPARPATPGEFGFRPDRAVTVHLWSPERHVEFAAKARAAIDIKGQDFRSRHKPPAKAIDFLASGLPLAMNPDSSPVEHLAGLGFRVCSPLDTDRWLSEAYWNEARAIGRQLRHDLTGPKVAGRFLKIVEAVLAERARPDSIPPPVHLADTPEGRPVPKKKPRGKRIPAKSKARHPLAAIAQGEYDAALRLALDGKHDEAWGRYERLAPAVADPRLAALIRNDLAALAALRGDLDAARAGFSDALGTHASCEPARANLERLSAHTSEESAASDTVSADGQTHPGGGKSVRVAVLSFLFNWPSTGGGIVHTVELVQFLARAGYDVRHVYARYGPWEVGVVTEQPPFESTALPFTEAEWDVPTIQARFRAAVEEFGPDYVIITDSWNVKPLLAEAVSGYPYLLRLQALECLCPLNNVRLLPEPGGTARQCPLHQLASPDACARCVRDRGHFSGDLHRAERSLSGVGTPEYREKLLKAFSEAEAVLVVNPLAEAMVAPYCKRALVVTAGMDPERFPWPPLPDADPPRTPGKLRVLFAGLTGEWMKGFHVLRSACARLWESRQDFELAVTGDSPDPPEPFARYVGWKTQAELPRLIRSCDVLAVPTVAQDALGRTAVEAMAAGVPVVASNLGGLPFTVADGATGLLFEPGDSADLAAKLSALLDDPDLRRRMGEAGRRRFEERYAWPVIIEKHYRPLLKPREARVVRVPAPPAPYAPYIPDRVDQERLKADIASCLGLRAARVDQLYRDYRSLHEREGYAERLGELKTLCFEEAFALHCVLAARRPATLVEVGTQQGKSARRLLDMQSALGLTSPLVCFDVADQVQHFRKDEARLVLCDLTGRFRSAVLDAFEPGLVFLDVHAHALLTEAVREVLADRRGWALAVHDCGRGLCNPRMAIAPEGPNVTSHTGVWERHVLAQAFGVPDPLDPRLDCATTATHRLTVLDTPHGLGLVLPR